MKQEVLRMERVSCVEQGVMQLDNFNLHIFSGEIMGLLPINNHGLTTLLQLLQRNTPLRYGYVYYRGERVNTWRAVKQHRNRIGLIQSERCLVDGLTVADNIFVLRPGFKTWLIRPKILKKQLFPFLKSIDIHINADSYVDELTPFEKAVVDVLKSVVAGCKLIILRDISSIVSEDELRKIHNLIRYYTAEGISFLYIDFHFEDIHQICDKVALLSNGRIIKVLSSDETMPQTFENYTRVYNAKVKEQISRTGHDQDLCNVVFEAQSICGEIINDLSFSITAGECVVMQDVDNQIFGELLSVLSGEKIPSSGKLLVCGSEFDDSSKRDISVIQELPSKTMLFNEMSYLDNLCFSLDHRLPEIWRSSSVREGIRREYACVVGEDVFDMRVDSLTEMQKYELVYTRIAIQNPRVAFCVQPFRRADIELRMYIWQLLKMLLERGIAVVILAVNLADSLSLADRLIRVHRDKSNIVYSRAEFASMPVSAPWTDLYQEIDRASGGEEYFGDVKGKWQND